jgi:hypothetical protein
MGHSKTLCGSKEVPELDELILELIDEAQVKGRNESLVLVGKSKGRIRRIRRERRIRRQMPERVKERTNSVRTVNEESMQRITAETNILKMPAAIKKSRKNGRKTTRIQTKIDNITRRLSP